MAHRPKRKGSADNRRPPTASKSRPIFPQVALKRFLDEAKNEQDPRLALELFQTVLDACRIPEEVSTFATGARNMWDVPDARLFLEALFGTGRSLRRLDRREEAVERFREVLRLDAGDDLFARYWLAAALMDLERHDEVTQLLERYDEPTAVWRYAQALLAFRLGGDTDDARRLLEEARGLDAGFLDYLLGEAQVDAARPVRFAADRHETAHATAALFLPAWRSAPGAASWARRVLKVPLSQGTVELPFPRREIRQLPRRRVRWQMGLRPMDSDAGDPAEAPSWMLAIADVDNQTMMRITAIEEEPTPEAVWHEVVSAFLRPLQGEPHRPARLEVPRADFCDAWKDMLAGVSVRCVYTAQPQPISDMLDGMAVLAKQRRLPPLPDGVDPKEFPQTDEVWQADFLHMPTLISNEEVGVQRPWSVLVLERYSPLLATRSGSSILRPLRRNSRPPLDKETESLAVQVPDFGDRADQFVFKIMQLLEPAPRNADAVDRDGVGAVGQIGFVPDTDQGPLVAAIGADGGNSRKKRGLPAPQLRDKILGNVDFDDLRQPIAGNR